VTSPRSAGNPPETVKPIEIRIERRHGRGTDLERRGGEIRVGEIESTGNR